MEVIIAFSGGGGASDRQINNQLAVKGEALLLLDAAALPTYVGGWQGKERYSFRLRLPPKGAGKSINIFG